MDKFFYEKYGLREDDFKPKTIKEQFGQGVADTFDRIEKEQRAKERKYFDLNTIDRKLNDYQKSIIDEISSEAAGDIKKIQIDEKYGWQLDSLYSNILRDYKTQYYDGAVNKAANFINLERFKDYINGAFDKFIRAEEDKENKKNDELQGITNIIDKHLSNRK